MFEINAFGAHIDGVPATLIVGVVIVCLVRGALGIVDDLRARYSTAR